MSEVHRRREELARKAAAVAAEKEKVVDLHKSIKDTIAEADETIAEMGGTVSSTVLSDSTKKGSKSTGRQDQGPTSYEVTYYDKEEWADRIDQPQTVQIFQSSIEAENQAEELQTQLDDSRSGYVETLAIHESRLRDMRENLANYSIDGRPIIGRDIMNYEEAIEEYKAGYENYEEQTEFNIGQLQDYAIDTIASLSGWSSGKRKAQAEYRNALADYSQQVSQQIGRATDYEAEPVGVPLKPGIPGPAWGPKPGSIGEKLQWDIQPRGKKVLEYLEKPFKMVTDPPRETYKEFDAKSIELGIKGEAVKGFGYYAAGTGLRTLAMGVDVATFKFRPSLWIGTGKTVGGLIFSPKTRTTLVGEVARDPFGFTAELAGGAYVGGKLIKLSDTAFKEAKIGYNVLKSQRGGRSMGLYGTSIKDPTWGKFWGEYKLSRAARKGVPETSLYLDKQFLEEMGVTEFPKETVFSSPTYRAYEKKWLKITDPKGDLSLELPYYGAVETSTPGADIIDIPGDEWAPEQISDTLDTAVPYELGQDGGFLKVEGGYGGMKPFAEAKPPTPARVEALVVTAESAPNTNISELGGVPTASLETRLEFIPDIDAVLSHRSGFKFILPETVAPPRLDISLMNISTVALLSKDLTKQQEKQFTIPAVSLEQVEKQSQKDFEAPLDIELPFIKQPQLIDLTPKHTTGIKPIQMQKPIQEQIQEPDLIEDLIIPQITIPEIPESERTFPDLPDPPEFPPPDDTDPLLILGTGPMKRSKLRRRESELMGWEKREYRLPTPDSELFLGGRKSRRTRDDFPSFSKKRKSIDDDLLFPRKKKRGKGIDLL